MYDSNVFKCYDVSPVMPQTLLWLRIRVRGVTSVVLISWHLYSILEVKLGFLISQNFVKIVINKFHKNKCIQFMQYQNSKYTT